MKATIPEQNKEYILIDHIGELTLDQFMKYKQIKNDYVKEIITEVDAEVQIVEAITKIDKTELYDLPYTSFRMLIDYCVQVLEQRLPTTITDTDIIIDNKLYRIDTKVSNYKANMVIDLLRMFKGDIYEYADEIAATVIRPVDTTTNKILEYSADIESDNRDTMKKYCTMRTFAPVANFFLNFYLALQPRSSLTSSQSPKKKKRNRNRNRS